jgi:hypothetical protein
VSPVKYELGFIFQKTTSFIVTAVRTSSRTCLCSRYVTSRNSRVLVILRTLHWQLYTYTQWDERCCLLPATLSPTLHSLSEGPLSPLPSPDPGRRGQGYHKCHHGCSSYITPGGKDHVSDLTRSTHSHKQNTFHNPLVL